MKIGVVVFPGANCDHDAFHALKDEIGVDTTYLFHKEHDLQGILTAYHQLYIQRFNSCFRQLWRHPWQL